jgi:ubiquinone/menaquinone biosynthesis C-methylase UbiE
MAESYKKVVWQHFQEFAPRLDLWHRRNFYYYQDLEKLHKFLIPPDTNVLEIGCGTGGLLAATQPKLGVGIDFSENIVAIAQAKYPQLKFYCLDAENLTPDQLPATTFDYIILSGVLGYINDIQATLEQLQPFCHARTRLILTFHNYLWEPLLTLAEKVGQRRPQPRQNWLAMADILNFLQSWAD